MPDVDTFVICFTTKCNLRCEYCCYSGQYRNSRTHGNESFATKENIGYLLAFISDTIRDKQVHIVFYGGESLIEFESMAGFVAIAEKWWDKRVRFSVSTNGTLLSNEIIDWAVKHNITLNISIDGPQSYHDHYRKSALGEGSYLVIYSALSFIQTRYPQFFRDKINILMTIYDLSWLADMSLEWMNDELLKRKPPKIISKVASNYSKDVQLIDEKTEKKRLSDLYDIFLNNPENKVLQVFFDQMTWAWDNRLVFPIDTSVTLQWCVPDNHKLYIDVDGGIGLCEKTCDTLRIGNIRDGIDWNLANKVAQELYSKRKERCVECPILRVCDICPTHLDLSDNEMDVFCHNQLVRFKLQFWLYCEMAEKELI